MTCVACGGPLRPWRRAPGSEPSDESTYLLLRCAACGTARTFGEAPSFAAAHEAGAYADGAPRGSGLAAPVLRAFDRRRLGLLGAPRGALLDVGAGRGRFVAAARAAGWDATGIEPSRRSAAANVSAVALEDAAVASASLAAASVWHVLEHLEDPGAAVERVADWLSPGGVLVVGVPNLASLQARLAGPRWFHLDLPRHRWHFTAGGVVSLLEGAGLEVERVEHVLLEHNPFGLWQSLVNRVTPTPSWLFHALKRNAPVRAADLVPTLLALPLVPLAVAVELAAGLARRGGTVAVVARKRG